MPFPKKDVLSVVVTGAAGQIGYALLPQIARGNMLGPNQKVELRLLEVEFGMKALGGCVLELEDCSFPLLVNVVSTSDPREAFKGADVAVMCGAFPRKQGMERKDLLEKNAGIFLEQGAIMKEVASPDIRVVVVGNPANTNALLLANGASGTIDQKNITALTRLDHNRAVSKAQSLTGKTVRDVTIWGNHSGTQVPSVEHAVADGAPVKGLCPEGSFGADFIKTIQQRGAAIIEARGASSAASASKAIVDHVHDWVLGTPEGETVSMSVCSTGNPYGVPDGLVYSFPVTCKDGEWTIKAGLLISAELQALMDITTKELMDEREMALPK